MLQMGVFLLFSFSLRAPFIFFRLVQKENQQFAGDIELDMLEKPAV